jgi:branched-chain amino acid transport system substrate-binding protein
MAQILFPCEHRQHFKGNVMKLSRRQFLHLVACAAALPRLATAQASPAAVYIADIVELSGVGAVFGTTWRDGVILAVEEVNARGGILGHKIEMSHLDTQSDAGISRAQVSKVLENDPYAVLGPVSSGSVLVDMMLTQQAEVPHIVGGTAPAITQKNHSYVFRTSFGQQYSMPKIANYLRDGLKAKTVAVLWTNNDFGKGGRDPFITQAKARAIRVVADISTETWQVDFSADVIRLKDANADVNFINTNEEESARFLREAQKQGVKAPLIGDTPVLSPKVIELAGSSANGVRGHVELSVEAPIPAVQAFADRFKKRFGYASDHNGIKGYMAIYMIKHVTEKMGKFDRKLFAETLHGLTITPQQEPGILMETTWDKNGDIDRASFLGEVVDGKQKIVEVLPKLGK